MLRDLSLSKVTQHACNYSGIDFYRQERRHPWRRSWLNSYDETYDPGVETLGPLAHDAKRWLIAGVTPALLTDVPNASPLLNVLRPLLAVDVAEVEREGPQWVQSIQQMPQLNPGQHSILIDLLVKFIMQRFVDLPYKELERMLKLTPLEQTRADRELMELGEIKGRVDTLHNAIRIVLMTRFPHTSVEMITRLMHVLSYVHDVETLEMLLQLAAQIDSYAAFEQKVLATAAKSALQETSNGKSSGKEEAQ